MTPHGLGALRRAALLCHTLPMVSVVLADADRTLVSVGRTPVTGARHHLAPCQFRTAVAQAWSHMRTGGRICFLGLPEGDDPVIDVGVLQGGTIHPGGILDVRLAEQTCLAFATTLGCNEAQAALAPLAHSSHGGGLDRHAEHPAAAHHDAVRLDLHHDEDLGCCLVWAERPSGTIDHGRALSVLRDALARCAAAEVDGELHQLLTAAR